LGARISLRSEVARAIRQTASRKATGLDEVPAELFKAGPPGIPVLKLKNIPSRSAKNSRKFLCLSSLIITIN